MAKRLATSAALPWVAIGLCLLLLGARCVYVGLAPFIQDEPKFLLAAWRQLETGTWATYSPLVGSSSLLYGPTPLWFFGVVQLLFGRSAETAIAAVAVVTTACQLAFVAMLHHRTRERTLWALASVLLIVASSPYQFFWSRLAWNLFPNFGPFLVVALLSANRIGPTRSALIGGVLGLCISAHPMVIPFAAVTLVCVAVAKFETIKDRVLCLTAAVFACAFVNLPWLYYLAYGDRIAVPAQGSSASGWTASAFFEPYRPHSTWGLAYFFDREWPLFGSQCGWLCGSTVELLTLVASAIVTIAGLLVLVLRHSEAGLKRVGVIGLICVVGYPAFFAILKLDNHPHYQFPLVWVTPAAAVGLFYSRSRRLVPLQLLAAVLGLACVAFTADWARFIWTNTGTRGIHYGTPVSEQVRFVRAACALPASSIYIIDQTAIFPNALQQHIRAEPSCRGKRFGVCPNEPCGPPASAAARVRLGYREAHGGALNWALVER